MKKLNFNVLFSLIGLLLPLASFAGETGTGHSPASVTRSTFKNAQGEEILRTEVTLDKTTSREALITACTTLAAENVQLTFDEAVIQRSFLGLLGKRRIAYVKGQITVPNGARESFKAGGVLGFTSVKITYARKVKTNEIYLEMVETVD